MITTGFTFRGIHSSAFGIVCDPKSRQLLPAKRRGFIIIPGRSGAHVQTTGSYECKTEQFTCGFMKGVTSRTIAEMSREIADWLSDDGVLEFDNEPGLFYNAFFTNSIPIIRHEEYASFELVFTYNPPFAYTEQDYRTAIVQDDADHIVIPVAGTAPTPVRIIIRNVGANTIENLRITRHLL